LLILAVSSDERNKIGVLGIAYKPNSTLAEDSQALFITEGLLVKKRRVTIYEPMGHHEAEKILGKKVSYTTKLSDILKKSDVVFVSNCDKKFNDMPRLMKNIKTEKTIIDPWGMFNHRDFNSKITYISPGRKNK